MSGQPYVCGEPRHTQGRAPAGWLQLRVAASSTSTWYCSRPCIALALGVDPGPLDDIELEAGLTEPWRAVAAIGRLSGTGLTALSATPDRLMRARLLAEKRVLDYLDRCQQLAAPLVDEHHAGDIGGRPSPATRDVAAAALLLHLQAGAA